MATMADFRNDIADFIRGKPRMTLKPSVRLRAFVRKIDQNSAAPSEKLVEMFRNASARHED